MELRQLNYFITVAETLNFSEAAKRLFITQGTLSQQIKQLEGEMNVDLFERTSHSVKLTEAGEELLPLARRTLEASKECQQKVSDLRKVLSGTLNIGVTHSFANLLTEPVRIFLRQHPGVKLNIFYKTATELHEMLQAGDVDFIIAFKPAAKYDGIASEKLLDSRLSAIMWKEHPLADRKMLTFDDISRYGIVLPGSGLQSRKAFDRFINVDTSRLDVRMELNEPNIIMDILHGTQMITIMSSLAAKYDAALVAIPIAEMQRELTGCVHWLSGAYQKRSASTFLEIFRACL